MFHLDWNLNVGTVLSVVVSASAILIGLAKMFWSAHKENQTRLGGIENRITQMESNAAPVHEWFREHVIKSWKV